MRAPQSRALVPLASVHASGRSAALVRASVPFLAQLIATAQQVAQTREKRRVDPEMAVAIYLAAAGDAAPMPASSRQV